MSQHVTSFCSLPHTVLGVGEAEMTLSRVLSLRGENPVDDTDLHRKCNAGRLQGKEEQVRKAGGRAGRAPPWRRAWRRPGHPLSPAGGPGVPGGRAESHVCLRAAACVPLPAPSLSFFTCQWWGNDFHRAEHLQGLDETTQAGRGARGEAAM